ncbi:hypothetical protein BOTBODRAFT_188384 [Botryobasidium botryosum FD-172 SS1]|uniref:Amino acid permease/ SLC12A domain-containing protein n=1 Tax=Botryobasidium botryosum (strain FD-172 SS1) TaxID=930990 RepID=A0A067MQ00_BOTB1|nr:hypothetical protein BOTBODRAFT_188384 [Botryobasidium botryosum FD-172 SS1]
MSHSGASSSQLYDTVATEPENGATLDREPVLRSAYPRIAAITIAISGTIGTGLFLLTSEAILHGGPFGVLLGYFLMGLVTFCVIISITELGVYYPEIRGGILGLVHFYGHPALAFGSGWLSWYQWAFSCPSHITSAIAAMKFYDSESGPLSHHTVWVSLSLALVVVVNFTGPRFFGGFELAFATLKVTTVVGLVLFGLVYDLGGVQGQGFIGFEYWHHHGLFSNYLGIRGPRGQLLGFLQITMQATFAFLGCEIPVVLVGETKGDHKNLRKTVIIVWGCIFTCYIFTVFVMGLIMPSNGMDSNGAADTSSVFVLVMKSATIKVLPQIVNTIFIASALSAATVDYFLASRYLYFLACLGHAPLFCKTLYEYGPKNGYSPVPTDTTSNNNQVYSGAQTDPEAQSKAIPGKTILLPWCLFFPFPIALLAYASAGSSSAARNASLWLSGMSSSAGLLSWAAMSYTYIRWYHRAKRSGFERPKLPGRLNGFLMRGQPYLAYLALLICGLVLLFNGWAALVASFAEGKFIIATEMSEIPIPTNGNMTIIQNEFPSDTVISTFVATYIPCPFFMLLVFGYNLIDQRPAHKPGFQPMDHSSDVQGGIGPPLADQEPGVRPPSQ